MRNFCLLFAMLLTIGNSAPAATISFAVADTGNQTPGGDPISEITYTFSGFDFNALEEIEIRYPTAIFQSIFDPVGGGPDFSLMAFQVDNPLGADGLLSIVPLVDGAELASPIRISAVLAGGLPQTLNYFVNELEAGTFRLVRQLSAGTATNEAAIPEPSTRSLVIVSALLSIAGRFLRSRPQGRILKPRGR